MIRQACDRRSPLHIESIDATSGSRNRVVRKDQEIYAAIVLAGLGGLLRPLCPCFPGEFESAPALMNREPTTIKRIVGTRTERIANVARYLRALRLTEERPWWTKGTLPDLEVE